MSSLYDRDYLNYQTEYFLSKINFRDVRRANSFSPLYFRGGGMHIRSRERLMRDRALSKRTVICSLSFFSFRVAKNITRVLQNQRDIPEPSSGIK